MWTSIEPWQLTQLQRMASIDPERIEHALNLAWYSDPTLLTDLAISAVDHEELSIDQAACMLGLSAEDIEERLVSFRNRTLRTDVVVVMDESQHVARLIKGRIAVWEIVRLFRKYGDLEGVNRACPSASPAEIAAALEYASQHGEEIEAQIRRYEDALHKRRVEYPFVK